MSDYEVEVEEEDDDETGLELECDSCNQTNCICDYYYDQMRERMIEEREGNK